MKLAQAWGACCGNCTARNTPAEVSNTATVSPAAGWVNCSSADSMDAGRLTPPPALSVPPRQPARHSAIARPRASRAPLHLPDILSLLEAYAVPCQVTRRGRDRQIGRAAWRERRGLAGG